MEISGEPGPLLAAAIVAAITQIEEEAAAAASVAPGRPLRGKWATSGTPRTVAPPHVVRPASRPRTAGDGGT